MKFKTDDERGHGPENAYVAIVDVARRNATNEGLFTPKQKKLAATVKAMAQAAHTSSKVYMNYRQTKIAIKVSDYRARDKLSAEFKQLANFCDANNVTAVLNTHNSLIYEIKV